MAAVDAFVLIAYFAAVVVVGVVAGRGGKQLDHYFLGDRRQPWLVVSLSILATELSAVTFIGVPGESFRKNCSYLQLYFGAFVGRMVIVWLLIPAFYGSKITTVYEYLGHRFGPWTRGTASFLFLVSRIIGSGLRLLAASIAVSVVMGWSLPTVIIGCAVVAVGYTTFGGIKAIIWTDALQSFVLLSAAAATLVFIAYATPGSLADQAAMAIDAGKTHVFNFEWAFNRDDVFVVLFVHTLFLNAAVFGTDQDLTHRMLTCRDARSARRSLTFNALMGLPVVVLFLAIGVGMWSYFNAFPTDAPPTDMRSEYVFPYFIANIIPSGWGLRGLLLAGVFAAAMSSLDSALGALSSTAVVDFYRPYIAPRRDDAHYTRVARLFVLFFGLMLTLIALAFISSTEILWEVFRWASLVFGSMLGIFLLGVTTRHRGHDRVNPFIMLSAVAILAAIKFWQDNDDPVLAWPWWIVFGTGWTYAGCMLFRIRDGRPNHPAV